MNRIISFIMLDFRSQPLMNKKAMTFFLVVTIASFLDNPSNEINVVFPLVLTTQLILNMFAPEKNRLETLHATLTLTRGDIVKARYLIFVCVLATMALMPVLIKFLFYPNKEIIYSHMTAAFIIVSFFTSVMFPLCFKIGSGKAQGIFALFFAIFIGAFFYSPEFRGQLSNTMSILTTSPVRTIAAGLILLYLSYLLSLKIYRTRDL